MKRQNTAHSQEYIENQFKSRNCELLDTYKNKSTPLKFRCKCGEISTITYGSFRRGSYCMGCGGKKKHTTEEIRKIAEERGCELLSEYKNAHGFLKIKCHCGNIYETVWSNFREGRSCEKCGIKKVAEALKLDFKYVKKSFEDKGLILLSKEYKSNSQKLDYICYCGEKSSITFANFQSYQRCRKCYVKDNVGPNHPNWNPDREIIETARKLRSKCSRTLRYQLQRLKIKKTQKTSKILGYTQAELLKHITNHPNWINVKDGKWSIDHIFPIKAFLEHGIHDLALINCLENLRPLDSSENFRKHAKYNKEEFKTWLKSKSILL